MSTEIVFRDAIAGAIVNEKRQLGSSGSDSCIRVLVVQCCQWGCGFCEGVNGATAFPIFVNGIVAALSSRW